MLNTCLQLYVMRLKGCIMIIYPQTFSVSTFDRIIISKDGTETFKNLILRRKMNVCGGLVFESISYNAVYQLFM